MALSMGAAGEVMAARFLREKGYDIVGVNVRTRFGEIDMIAQKDSYLVFVEVKTRGEDALYEPREAVTDAKQSRILKTAALYLQAHPTDRQPRFDVIEVFTGDGDPQTPKAIDHIENAFESGDLHAAF